MLGGATDDSEQMARRGRGSGGFATSISFPIPAWNSKFLLFFPKGCIVAFSMTRTLSFYDLLFAFNHVKIQLAFSMTCTVGFYDCLPFAFNRVLIQLCCCRYEN